MEFIKKGNEGGGINDNDENDAFIDVSDLPNKDSIKENKTRKKKKKKNYKFEEEKKVNNKNIKSIYNPAKIDEDTVYITDTLEIQGGSASE